MHRNFGLLVTSFGSPSCSTQKYLIMTVSPELTFIPVKHPHEILTEGEGKLLLKKVEPIMVKMLKYGLVMRAKLDPHHDCYTPEQTYCIEVVPYLHWSTHWFNGPDWFKLEKGLKLLFSGMKDLGFAPLVTTRRKGVETDWPGGGCHLHYGIGFMRGGPDWYQEMELFHKNLIIDYANRPYIRWLFKQWFADETGGALVTRKEPLLQRTGQELFTESFLTGEIEARFMGTSKGTYPTFELRPFSMVANPAELKAIVLFAETWLITLQRHRQQLDITITKESLRRMGSTRSARKICSEYIKYLGLDWCDYEVFFERNYVKRIKYGQMY